MSTIKSFEEMELWQDARELCRALYSIIDDSWNSSNRSLKDQVLSSSGSIMDNIAEGFERGSTKEFVQFLGFSKGSCGEFRSQLYRAKDAGLITKEQFDSLMTISIKIAKQLRGFISYLNKQPYKGNRFMESDVEYQIDREVLLHEVISNFRPQISNQ